LEIAPFSETDRRSRVAFLAAQMFRTPWFLVQSLAGLRDSIPTRDTSYPTDVASPRRAHAGAVLLGIVAGFAADAFGLPVAMQIVAALTFLSGVFVAALMSETRPIAQTGRFETAP